MSLRDHLRQALPPAMRARDKAAVSALRSAIAAVDNAEAVPAGGAGQGGQAIEQLPVGAGATEVARRELDETTVRTIVRAEVTERLEAAQQLTAPVHAERAARLRAEAAVLREILDATDATDATDAAGAAGAGPVTAGAGDPVQDGRGIRPRGGPHPGAGTTGRSYSAGRSTTGRSRQPFIA